MLKRDELLTTLNSIIDGMRKTTLKGSDDWVYLASLGIEAKKAEIIYREYGNESFLEFIQGFKGLDIYKDDEKEPPVYLVRKTGKLNFKSTPTEIKKKEEKIPSLSEWANLGDSLATHEDLKQLALEEDWGNYEDEQGRVHYPILMNYLNYTFHKLFLDKGILYSNDEQFASFNTGLVDDRYLPIYALFKKNMIPKLQEWYLVGFCIVGENKAGKTLNQKFDKRPPRANFFKSTNDLLFDTSKDVELDYEHIIIERIDRFPYDFVCERPPKGFNLLTPKEIQSMDEPFLKEYYANLGEAIKEDKECYTRHYVNTLKNALELAIKRVQWNYKSAIPMYYPHKRKMCHFLPLSLIKDNVVDLALVVEKTESGTYQGATIYPLEWAYRYARLICRPDSDWLEPQVDSKVDTDEEND